MIHIISVFRDQGKGYVSMVRPPYLSNTINLNGSRYCVSVTTHANAFNDARFTFRATFARELVVYAPDGSTSV